MHTLIVLSILPNVSRLLTPLSLLRDDSANVSSRILLGHCGVLLQLLGDGGDLLHSVLVSGQVALKGLVLPHQGSDLHQRSRLVVLLRQKLLLA